jgi:hypothetical protein
MSNRTAVQTPRTDAEGFRLCPHCNVRQFGGTAFENVNADPALDAMAHLCWKCVKPLAGN